MNFPPSTTPTPTAVRLGYLALVPFVAGAALPWLVDGPNRAVVAEVLSAYAAVVISFIGAIHWGLGIGRFDPAPRLFVWGIVPSLVAWVAVLATPRYGLPIEAAMLVVCYAVDHREYWRLGVGAWRPFRLRLTVGATAGCVAGAAALWR